MHFLRLISDKSSEKAGGAELAMSFCYCRDTSHRWLVIEQDTAPAIKLEIDKTRCNQLT